MQLSPSDQAKILLDKVRRTEYAHPESGGAGRAYLIASLVISLDENTTTLFHYPAFYNMHHSLELLIKGVFKIESNAHRLMTVVNKNVGLIDGYFTPEELMALQASDTLNSNRGQLRYYDLPHKQFDMSLFIRLGIIAQKLIEEDLKRNRATN